MLTAYSLNQTVAAGAAVPISNVLFEKGCSAKVTSPSSITLNRGGEYLVTVNASSAAATSIALSYNGVVMPNTVMTGESNSFTTYVPVVGNNGTCRCCYSPATLQVVNPSDTEAVYTVVNITVKKDG